MPRLSSILTAMAVFLALAVIPRPALAGGSAGNNQYVDPLSGVQHHSGSSSTSSPPSAPGRTTPVQTAASTTSTASALASATTSATTPTATTAAPTGTSGRPSKTLPFTGSPDWEVAALGAALILGGVGLRRAFGRA